MLPIWGQGRYLPPVCVRQGKSLTPRAQRPLLSSHDSTTNLQAAYETRHYLSPTPASVLVTSCWHSPLRSSQASQGSLLPLALTQVKTHLPDTVPRPHPHFQAEVTHSTDLSVEATSSRKSSLTFTSHS